MSLADDLCIEIGSKLGVVVGQVLDGEVAAERRPRKVNILEATINDKPKMNRVQSAYHDGHRHIIGISATLLDAYERCARVEAVLPSVLQP